MDFDLESFIGIGERLGYTGVALRQYAEGLMAQAAEREERAHRREIERTELAAKVAAQAELERQRTLELEIQLKATPGGGQPATSVRSSRPKLPRFDEQTDDMDAFLARFETFAKCQRWDKAEWAVDLSALLTGKGLQVFNNMPSDQVNNYDQLKVALLQRYELTEDGFRRKFRESKPSKGENVFQFGARLKRFFDRWTQLAKTAETYNGLRDLLIREQFLEVCHPDLAVFLRERNPSTFDEMSNIAQQYVDAHGSTLTGNKFGKRDPGPMNRRPMPQLYQSNEQRKPEPRVGNPRPKSEVECFNCHKKGHIARDCKSNATPPKKFAGGAREDTTQRQGGGRKQEQPGKEKTTTGASGGEKGKAGLGQAIIAKGSPVEQHVVDGCLKLDDGTSIPVETGACDMHRETPDGHNMEVCDAFLGDTQVRMMRDTGCSSAAVRTSLVRDDQLTGKVHLCILIDGTARTFPIARIQVDTPYFVGEIEAMCMRTPIYDLIIGNADGVSKDPDPDWRPQTEVLSAVTTRAQEKKKGENIKPLNVTQSGVESIDVDKLKEEQQHDSSLKKLMELAKADGPVKTRGRGQCRYELHKEILYRLYEDDNKELRQIVVPLKYRQQVMTLAHESIVGGHLGAKKTGDRIASSFYWPGVVSDVTRFCQSCDICQRTTPKGRISKVPLGEMPLMEEPFQRIAVDLIGPIAPITDKGNRYILTIVDYATRYPEAIPLPKIEAERVAEAMFETFCRIGFPREVLSDCGTQFTSDVMKEVSRLISLKQLFTTPYNPKCNGLCERVNGVLKSMLKKMCQERPQDWDRYLPAVLFAYREVPQASTGFSPFELLYGRTVRGPMQILKELWTGSEAPDVRNTYEYVLDLRNRLEETCELARKNLQESGEAYKHHYDKKTRSRRFKIGDRVLVLLPTDSNKLLVQWKGPYEVTEVLNKVDYRVRVGNKIKTYHANLLKIYIARDYDDSINGDTNVAAIAVIQPEMANDEGAVDDEHLLELGSSTQKETYKDVKISDSLTREQRQEALTLLEEYSDIFTEKPGTTHLVEHKIETISDEPVRVKPYGLPYATRHTIQEEIDNMLESGVIEPSDSPYNSPVVLVKKKDGTNRFCIDFRRLNSITKFDSEPMGNPDDIMAKIDKDCYFTKIDLTKGYWQIMVAEESRPMTSFVVPSGCYRFIKMPFGLVNSAATFNRMMRMMLAGSKNVEHYVDDILCHDMTWNEHLRTLRSTFQRIREAGLTIRPTKCSVGYNSVDFVGHVVGKGSLSMDEEKLGRIKEAPQPKTKKQVRSFLGLAGYYRKFIPNYAEIAVPLTDLTKKNQPNQVKWGDAQQHAFDTLRDLLTKAPILRLPDFSKPFIVQTDASDSGIGCILLQEYDDGRFPVVCASKKLLPRERNYSVIERECLAIVFAVKKFAKYLYGREFILHTDHQPLSYIHRAKLESGRIMRWALFLQNYRFRIESIKGSENVGADYLSRMEV